MVQSEMEVTKIESKPIDVPDVVKSPQPNVETGTSPSSKPREDADDEDEFAIPEASPAFISVMSNFHISPSNSDPHLPLSPLVLSDLPPEPFDFSQEDNIQDIKSSAPMKQSSPDLRRKRISSASAATSSGSRTRSYSWNHRHKMVMERRNAANAKLVVPGNNSGPSSTNSSPLIMRKPKTKSQPSTPKVTRLVPKYKFLTETVSVSHEDIVKEQDRERRLAEGFEQSKSIFENPRYHRFGESPA